MLVIEFMAMMVTSTDDVSEVVVGILLFRRWEVPGWGSVCKRCWLSLWRRQTSPSGQQFTVCLWRFVSSLHLAFLLILLTGGACSSSLEKRSWHSSLWPSPHTERSDWDFVWWRSYKGLCVFVRLSVCLPSFWMSSRPVCLSVVCEHVVLSVYSLHCLSMCLSLYCCSLSFCLFIHLSIVCVCLFDGLSVWWSVC